MPLTRAETPKETLSAGLHSTQLLKIDADTTGLEANLDITGWSPGRVGYVTVEVSFDAGATWEFHFGAELTGGVKLDRFGNPITHRKIRRTWDRNALGQIVGIPNAARITVDLERSVSTALALEAR